MNFPTREQVERLRERYPPGTVLQLTADMPGERIHAGAIGEVIAVDDAGSIHMKWRQGGSLALIPGADSFRKIAPEKEKKRGHDHAR